MRDALKSALSARKRADAGKTEKESKYKDCSPAARVVLDDVDRLLRHQSTPFVSSMELGHLQEELSMYQGCSPAAHALLEAMHQLFEGSKDGAVSLVTLGELVLLSEELRRVMREELGDRQKRLRDKVNELHERTCRECGKKYQATNKYCPSCGKRVS